MLWLVVFCAVTLLAVALPGWVRLVICVTAATSGTVIIRRVILLRGAAAIRALEWLPDGSLRYFQGSDPRPREAVLARGSFRLGRRALLLWLGSADGIYGVFIDPALQDARALRRLCRWLEWRSARAPDKGNRPS